MNGVRQLMDQLESVLAGLSGNLKLVESALLGFEGSYVELLTLLSLGLLAIIPVVTPPRHRQVMRHVTQVLGLIVFVLLVFTCLGVFGIIRNTVRGLREIGHENIIALYYCSVPVVIMASAMVFGPFFCGWICPTGAMQEFAGMLTRRFHVGRKQRGQPFSWIMLGSLVALSIVFLVWIWYLSLRRVFFIDDAAAYWAMILLLIGLLSCWHFHWWDRRLRRLRIVSFVIILIGAIADIRITSPVHFGFCKVYDPASILATLIVIGVAMLIPQAWCRYLCPWREVLSWTGRHSVRRVAFDPAKCTHCGACDRSCWVDAVAQGQVDRHECHLCLKCIDRCPSGALSLQEKWEEEP